MLILLHREANERFVLLFAVHIILTSHLNAKYLHSLFPMLTSFYLSFLDMYTLSYTDFKCFFSNKTDVKVRGEGRAGEDKSSSLTGLNLIYPGLLVFYVEVAQLPHLSKQHCPLNI